MAGERQDLEDLGLTPAGNAGASARAGGDGDTATEPGAAPGGRSATAPAEDRRDGHGEAAPPPPVEEGAPRAAAGRNPLSIVALVVAVLGLLIGPLGLIGAGLGAFVRKKVGETGQQGANLALAAIIVGLITFVLWLALLATK